MSPRMRLLTRVALVLAVVFAGDFLWRTLNSQEAKPVVKTPATVTAARPAAAARPVQQPPVAVPVAAQPAVPASAGPWRAPHPLASYAPVFDAPLFLPSRSAAPPPPPPSETVESAYVAPDPMDTAQLVGVAVGDNADIALVMIDGALQRLEPGDALGEWVLTEIGEKRAVFMKEEESRELVMPNR
jgi:hypothetical protein